MTPATQQHQLALVMPVYNEEECIEEVVRSWNAQFEGLGIDFLILVLNDGSTDGTESVLAVFDDVGSVQVINKKNSGHGPTILMGYRKAVDLAEWVFQCDSDNEMKPDNFGALWGAREEFDALFGCRTGRVPGGGRKLISACSCLTVRFLFGKGIVDVNTPYRLIRADLLSRIVRCIPDDTFAPNVILSGMLVKCGARISNHPVPHEPRQTGQCSIVKLKLWKAAFRSFLQTLTINRRVERMDRVDASSKPSSTEN